MSLGIKKIGIIRLANKLSFGFNKFGLFVLLIIDSM